MPPGTRRACPRLTARKRWSSFHRTPAPHDIAQMLEKQGVMKYGLLFELDVRMKRLAGPDQGGRICHSDPRQHEPGRRHPGQWQGCPAQADSRRGLDQQHDLETGAERQDPDRRCWAGAGGRHLLPETYLFTRGETRAHMLARMRGAQEKFLLAKWRARAGGLPFKTMREVIILASLVEKETSQPCGAPSHRIGLRQPAEGRHEAADRSHYHLWHHQGLSAGARHPPERDRGRDALQTPMSIGGLPPGAICNPGKDFPCRSAGSGRYRRPVLCRQRHRRACLCQHHVGAPAQCRGHIAPRNGTTTSLSASCRKTPGWPSPPSRCRKPPRPSCRASSAHGSTATAIHH